MTENGSLSSKPQDPKHNCVEALRSNIDIVRSWQGNSFDLSSEQSNIIRSGENPLLGTLRFFFSRDADAFHPLTVQAGMTYDSGRMEDYVFHEIGKARATIRAHSMLFADISDIWESIRENDADSAVY